MSAQRTVTLVPYDPTWPRQFAQEREALLGLLGSSVTAIHHIGSTSVPRLTAKPIIDLLAEADSLAALEPYRQALAQLGYIWKGEHGIAGRRYFQKGGNARTHHLHVYACGDPEIARHLRFRDLLRTNPEAARRYQDAKLLALTASQGHPEAYQSHKSAVILALLGSIAESMH